MRTPREYQKLARRFFVDRERAALWAKPGMGKTGSTLLTLTDLVLSGDSDRILVVGPKRVAQDVWRDELPRWPDAHDVLGDVVSLVGDVKHRERGLRIPARVYAINYESLPWLVDRFGEAWPFDTVVADESSKLRGFRLGQGTLRARALSRNAHGRIRRFYQLTGTPAANSLSALWGQIWFLDEGKRLGRSFEAYKERWFYSSGEHGKAVLTPLPFAQEQITEALSDLCLTLRPSDWFDLREPVRTRVRVTLPPAAMAIYKRFRKEMYAALDDNRSVSAFSAAAKTMKCLQLANGAAYTNPEGTVWSEVHTAKLEALEEIVEETTDSSVMVAYQFVADRQRILKAFPKAVDLATPRGMAAFKAGDAPLGVGHPASVGHGVDGLQEVCNSLVFFGHWWDAEEREQIIERVGPMRQAQAGKDRPLFLYDIVADGTIDDVVMSRHETKRSVQELLMEAMRRDR